MQQQLIIKGMHCEACKALIRMELVEQGYEEKIKSLALSDDMTGILDLQNVSLADLEQMKTVINSLGAYEVHD